MGDHALAFRVVRLHPDATPDPDRASHPLGAPSGASPAFSDASASRHGGGPAGFGTVYLGQTLTLAVALLNASQGPVHNVGIRASY